LDELLEDLREALFGDADTGIADFEAPPT